MSDKVETAKRNAKVTGRKGVAALVASTSPVAVAQAAPVDAATCVAAPAPIVHTINSDLSLIVTEAEHFGEITIKREVKSALERRCNDEAAFKATAQAARVARIIVEAARETVNDKGEIIPGTVLTKAEATSIAGFGPTPLLFHGAKGTNARTADQQKWYSRAVAAWNYMLDVYGIKNLQRKLREPSAPGSKTPLTVTPPQAPAVIPATATIAPEAINVVTCSLMSDAMAQLRTWSAFGQRVGNASAAALVGDKGERARKLLAYVAAEMATLDLMN
jgi:hypothetical protein